MPVKPPISAAMLVMVARSSTLSSSMASPAYSMTLARRLAAAHVIEAENLQNEIFGGDVGMPLAANDNLHRLGHFDPNIFGDPRIENVGGADAKRDAADRAHMRRMRIRANVQLPRQRVAFKNDGVADAFGTFAVGQFAVQPYSLLLGEILLLEFELRGQIEQAELFLLFGDHLVEKCQVIAEEQDAGGIVDLGVFADIALEEDRRHGRDVFMAEAQIGAGKSGVARLD